MSQPALEQRVLTYGRALYRLREAHVSSQCQQRAQGGDADGASFPMAPSQLVRLAHFAPLIPPQAKYLNLATFLLKPIAADFCFLQPLVECDKPTAAKNAFFASLSTVKTAVAAIATSELMSEERAAKVVETIVEAMDGAVAAGRGRTSKTG